MALQRGRLLRGIGGFYYVETPEGEWECRARGIFRRRGQTPLAGDMVSFSPLPDQKGVLEEIEPRRNELIRPPVANVDILVIVASLCEPEPNALVLDKMIAIAEDKEIEPLVVFNKSDLASAEKWQPLYERAGFSTVLVSAETGEGIPELRQRLAGKIAAFTGNSGVGKSSLLNRLDARLGLETAAISSVLGRGRHTTRFSALYRQPEGGYLVDTPGFSSLDTERIVRIPKENLEFCFREFAPYLGQCKFASCRHRGEAGCAICQAANEGRIAASRLASYQALLSEAMAVPDWENRI